MANPVWPPSLRQDFMLGLVDKRGAAVARFTNDAGPASVRRIFSNPTRTISVPIHATLGERLLIDQFYAETLQEGSLEFDFKDPVTGAAATFRFLESIEWQHTRAGNDGGLYSIGTLRLERMP